MADAKSRYEIVNELTEKKTGILDTITNLKNKVSNNEANISQTERNQDREAKSLAEKHAEHLEDIKFAHKVLEKNTNTQIVELEKKVTAYNDAIESIKAISGGIDSKKEE